MSKKKKAMNVDDLDIPEGWLVIEMTNEIHVVPEDDILDHDLDFFQCPCGCVLLNKDSVMDSSERAVYSHNLFVGVEA